MLKVSALFLWYVYISLMYQFMDWNVFITGWVNDIMRTYFPISRRLFECSRTLIYTCVRAFRAEIFVIPDLYYVNVVHDLYIGNEFFY